MKKVFLGGTCNDSTWRDDVMRRLKIGYYNPMGETWTPDMMEEEIHQREICDFCLYVLTPKMEGYYSIAELADDSNKRPEKTLFCYLEKDGEHQFTPFQITSLKQVADMVKKNGAKYFKTLDEVIEFLNQQ